VVRYFLFAMAAPDQVFRMVWLGILLHGLCYDFFFVTGQVYVEKKASPDIRAQAQGFLVMMTLGVGMFIGMLVSGPGLFNWMVFPLDPSEQYDQRMNAYWLFWMIPTALALIVLIGFALLFHDPQVEKQVSEEDDGEEVEGNESAATEQV
jgi:hypothetical protein